MSFSTRRTVRRVVLTGLAVVMTVVFIFPLYWIATMSFQDGVTASTLPPKFIFVPTLQNFHNLFETSGFGAVMWNTTAIAIGTTCVALLFGTPAAYALARFPVGSAEQISFTVLSVRIVPSYVAVVPLFIILQQLNLFGTALGVIVASSLVGISFVIWMMRAFFAAIPSEIEDAAMIDGCSRLGSIARIALPLAAPGLVATGVFTAIGAWNELVLVLILGGEAAKTMPVALAGLVTEQRAEWGQLAAGGVLTMLPVIVFALLVRRYFLSGVTAGGVNA
ncbi:MAG: carbohydrate ABC transporter permease [Chloroflexi bacterium]|nr:carbohydrate ABC transporter permease [Chloroflexota bacterium]